MTITIVAWAVGVVVALSLRPKEVREIAAMLVMIGGAFAVLMGHAPPKGRHVPPTAPPRRTAGLTFEQLARHLYIVKGSISAEQLDTLIGAAMSAGILGRVLKGSDLDALLEALLPDAGHPIAPPVTKMAGAGPVARDVVAMSEGQTAHLGDIIGPERTRLVPMFPCGACGAPAGEECAGLAGCGDGMPTDREARQAHSEGRRITMRRRTYTTISGDEVETFEPAARDLTDRERI